MKRKKALRLRCEEEGVVAAAAVATIATVGSVGAEEQGGLTEFHLRLRLNRLLQQATHRQITLETLPNWYRLQVQKLPSTRFGNSKSR